MSMSSLGFALDSLPDIVRDLQRAVRFDSYDQLDLTVHPPSSHRYPAQESWTSKRVLRRAERAEVILQEQVPAQPIPKLRVVKRIRVADEPNQFTPQSYRTGLELLSKFSQPEYSEQFVSCLGWYTGVGMLHIVTEYFELGDLERYLPRLGGRLFESDVCDVTWQILSGLLSLHQANFSHGDLKLSNVLVVTTHPAWRVKLTDFGLDQFYGAPADMHLTEANQHNAPPELLSSDGGMRIINPCQVDMWHLGQVAYRLAAGCPMFTSHASLAQHCLGQTPIRESVLRKHGMEDSFIHFVKALAEPRPAMRITSKDALEFSWTRSYQGLPMQPDPIYHHPEPVHALPNITEIATPSPAPAKDYSKDYFEPVQTNEPTHAGVATTNGVPISNRGDPLADMPHNIHLVPTNISLAGSDQTKSPTSSFMESKNKDDKDEEESSRLGKRGWKYFAKIATNLTQSTPTSPSASDGHSMHENQQLRKQSSLPGSPALEVPSRMPSGWSTQLDEDSQQWFFVNRYTNQSQWEVPVSPAKPASPAKPVSPALSSTKKQSRPNTPSSTKKRAKGYKAPNAQIARIEESFPDWAR